MTGALARLKSHYQNAYITRDLDMRVRDDWNGFRAAVERQKLPVIMEGGSPGQSQWLYIDARDTVGHYLEYCYMSPERWTQLGGR